MTVLVQYWPTGVCFLFQKGNIVPLFWVSCWKIVVSEKLNWPTVFCFLFERSGWKKGNIGPVSPCSRLPAAQACQIMSFQLDTRLPSLPLKRCFFSFQENIPLLFIIVGPLSHFNSTIRFSQSLCTSYTVDLYAFSLYLSYMIYDISQFWCFLPRHSCHTCCHSLLHFILISESLKHHNLSLYLYAWIFVFESHLSQKISTKEILWFLVCAFFSSLSDKESVWQGGK